MSAAGRIAGLHRAAAVLAACDDAELRAIGEDLGAWLSRPDDTPLERALGIAAEQSRRTPRTMAGTDRRNSWLRRGAQECGMGAPELAIALADFEARIWPREAHLDTCPERHRGTIRWHLWHAMRCWPHPIKERRLRDIIGNEHPGLIAEQLCDGLDAKGDDDVEQVHELQQGCRDATG